MNAHDATEAARLLLLSLTRTRPPGGDEEHTALGGRYLAEPEFRRLTAAVAEGLMLEIRDALTTGLVVVPQPDSPFEENVRGYRTNDARELGDAVSLCAIVATAFPHPEHLEDSAVRRVSLQDVQDHLETLLARLAQREGRETAQDDAEGETWRALHRLAAEARGKNGKGLGNHLARAFRKLLERRLLTPDRRGGGADTYFTTDALRVMARDVVGLALYQELRRA